MFTRLYCNAKVRVLSAIESADDEGQGTMEYIGMVLLAGVLIVAVIGVFTGAGAQWAAKIKTVVDKITSIG